MAVPCTVVAGTNKSKSAAADVPHNLLDTDADTYNKYDLQIKLAFLQFNSSTSISQSVFTLNPKYMVILLSWYKSCDIMYKLTYVDIEVQHKIPYNKLATLYYNVAPNMIATEYIPIFKRYIELIERDQCIFTPPLFPTFITQAELHPHNTTFHSDIGNSSPQTGEQTNCIVIPDILRQQTRVPHDICKWWRQHTNAASEWYSKYPTSLTAAAPYYAYPTSATVDIGRHCQYLLENIKNLEKRAIAVISHSSMVYSVILHVKSLRTCIVPKDISSDFILYCCPEYGFIKLFDCFHAQYLQLKEDYTTNEQSAKQFYSLEHLQCIINKTSNTFTAEQYNTQFNDAKIKWNIYELVRKYVTAEYKITRNASHIIEEHLESNNIVTDIFNILCASMENTDAITELGEYQLQIYHEIRQNLISYIGSIGCGVTIKHTESGALHISGIKLRRYCDVDWLINSSRMPTIITERAKLNFELPQLLKLHLPLIKPSEIIKPTLQECEKTYHTLVEERTEFTEFLKNQAAKQHDTPKSDSDESKLICKLCEQHKRTHSKHHSALVAELANVEVKTDAIAQHLTAVASEQTHDETDRTPLLGRNSNTQQNYNTVTSDNIEQVTTARTNPDSYCVIS
jgi:hypothetical protein